MIWINVKDRLPDNGRSVLAEVNHEGLMIYVVASYQPFPKTWNYVTYTNSHEWDRIPIKDSIRNYGNVIAWCEILKE